MLKIITSAALLVLFFTACTHSGSSGNAANDAASSDTAVQVITPPVVGNDRDEHGCIGSAGYTWSQLKNECVRIFEAGIRLNAAGEGVDSTTSAFVIFNADQSKAELFLPTEKGAKMMERQGAAGSYSWASGALRLHPSKDNSFALKDGDRLLYQGK